MKMPKYSLIPLIIVIGLIWYDYSTERPKRLSAINSQKQTNENLRSDLEQALQLRNQVFKMKQDMAEIERQMKDLSALLPTRSEAGILLEQLTNLPTEGLRIESITPKASNRKTVNVELKNPPVTGSISYEEFEMGIEMLTTFRNLGKYLENIEKIPRIISITGLRMSVPSLGRPMAVSMIVKTFVLGG